MTWWTWHDLRGALVERIEGQVLDLSASGCRMASRSTLPVGSVGVLEVRDLDEPISRAARVQLAFERPGAALRYVLHLEFLSLPPLRGSGACGGV